MDAGVRPNTNCASRAIGYRQALDFLLVTVRRAGCLPCSFGLTFLLWVVTKRQLGLRPAPPTLCVQRCREDPKAHATADGVVGVPAASLATAVPTYTAQPADPVHPVALQLRVPGCTQQHSAWGSSLCWPGCRWDSSRRSRLPRASCATGRCLGSGTRRCSGEAALHALTWGPTRCAGSIAAGGWAGRGRAQEARTEARPSPQH